MKRHLLLILDGYGIAEDPSVSAIDQAETPYLDRLFANHPNSTLKAAGRAVGLPEGQMGNSEVGHLNLGAGRVVYQEITRISKSIEEGDFYEAEALEEAATYVKQNDGKLHLMGLFSDGGVHSSLDHLYALLEWARRREIPGKRVLVHAFTDGRDTDPHGGVQYAKQFEERAASIGVGQIASIVGRYYAMDRDERWDRTEKAYRLLTRREGDHFETATEALKDSYSNGITDEFVKPRTVELLGDVDGRIEDGDAVVFFNFRADRARQLTRALGEDRFNHFDRNGRPEIVFVTMMPYDHSYGVPTVFDKVDLKDTMGEVLSRAGKTQLRAAETEKYAHVTYFFSGGREEPFEGEERILVPSPKVATYDLKPEMSVMELAQKTADHAGEKHPDFICLNFANPDMVGHTGDFDAAVAAVEASSRAAEIVVEAAREEGYGVTIIADHGNADKMKNPDGSPNTAHTTALVPHIIIHDAVQEPPREGKLGDVAPTILHLMDVDAPERMTGEVLVQEQLERLGS